MTELLETRKLDRAGRAAIAVALDRLPGGSTTGQVYARMWGRNACVNAMRAPSSEEWPGWSAAAARRAATGGRRLLPVLGSGQLDGWLWIAYEMGSTSSLSDHPRRLRLPTATSLRLLLDVARALDGAALAGLFPHELAPASVFVSRHGAHLGDLGTAQEALLRSGSQAAGNTTYVPTEVQRGEPAGERSGVYVFGALLYHLLSGASPRRGQLVPLASWRPDLSPRLDSIVATAMSDEPRRRPRSALEVHELAKLALEGETRRPSAAAAPAAAPAAARTPDPPEPAPPAACPHAGSARALPARRLPTRRIRSSPRRPPLPHDVRSAQRPSPALSCSEPRSACSSAHRPTRALRPPSSSAGAAWL